MKTNRQNAGGPQTPMPGRLPSILAVLAVGLIGTFARSEPPGGVGGGAAVIDADRPADETAESAAPHRDGDRTEAEARQLEVRREAARQMVERTVRRLTSGPAFDAKLTQEIRAQGRSSVGVGRYEQAGGNTGRMSMEMMIPTSNGKCFLQQMCDGRLAWTREQVGETIRLRRVDVGRLDELVGPNYRGVAPRLRVGGLVELLQQANRDYDLEQVPAKLEDRPVWMLRGALRPKRKQAILAAAEREDMPPLLPQAIAIAIAAEAGPEGFGKGLPIRFEYWTSEDLQERRLISYLKIYDLRAIEPAPERHFRFETGEADVNYVNDTQRYLDRFDIQLTHKQQRLLLR